MPFYLKRNPIGLGSFFLFNDRPNANYFETSPAELTVGQGFFVGDFSVNNEIAAVRGA
jgi:hypothetical protein